MVLTDRQRKDLHAAIAEYLTLNGLAELGQQVTEALQAKAEGGIRAFAAGGGAVLEKKWSNLLRLQQKVTEMEKKLSMAQQDMDDLSNPDRGSGKANRDYLPIEPARQVLEGHREQVSSVCLHPKYAMCASASKDYTVRIWDYETGECEKSLRDHTHHVNAVTFDITGAQIATCSSDQTVKVWVLQTGQCIRTFSGHQHTVSDVRFLPPPPEAAAGGASAEKGKEPSGAPAVVDSLLISCSRDHSVKVWDLNTGFCKKTLQDHSDWVRCLAVSDDGHFMATGGMDQTAKVYSTYGRDPYAPWTCISTLAGFSNAVECIAFTHGGPEDEHLQGWISRMEEGSPTKGAAPAKERKQGEQRRCRFAAVGSRDKSIQIFEIGTGKRALQLIGHDDWVQSLAFHPGGKYLLSVSDDRTIRIWDLESGRCKRTLENSHSHFVTALALHPAGKPIIATGSVDQKVKIWNCR